jgi:DnaJ-class molecular chaperone
MSERIWRRVESFEEVEVPDGMLTCGHCNGKGSMSQYDEGWHSLSHSPKMAAQVTCLWCNGLGYAESNSF